MLVQTVVLSVALIAALIILFACIGGNINLKMKIDELETQNRKMHLIYLAVYKEYTNLLMKPGNSKSTPIEPEIQEAIYYAMLKAHPDNGGKQEDFIKFRNLYERIRNEHR